MENSGIAKTFALAKDKDVFQFWAKKKKQFTFVSLWNVHNSLPQCQDFYSRNWTIILRHTKTI